MRALAFYSRVALLIACIALIIYVCVALVRFLYYRHIALELVTVSQQLEYTVGAGLPVYTVAVVGDSTAYGVGGKEYTSSYHYQFLREQPGTFVVKNYGISGARVADLHQQLSQIDTVDVLFISITANDVTHFTRLSELRTTLNEALTVAEQKSQVVLLVTPGSFENAHIFPHPVRKLFTWRRAQISPLVKDVVDQHPKVISVDVFAHPQGSFGDNPELYYADDFFHPSHEGYGVWKDIITQTITKHGGLHL